VATRGTRRPKPGTGRREQREREAAWILATRIAEGRPPEEVWIAAAQRQAQRGHIAGGWYASATPAPPRQEPLTLRVVRLR
jgi:hypothetical protein